MTVGRIPSVEGGIQPTIVDAKGDIIAATAADTVARLAVGANDTILVADSSEATGLKWATPAATTPSFVGAMVFKTAEQSIANNTEVAITFTQATDYLDTDGFHDPTSNSSRMTIPAGKAGKYLVFGNLMYDNYNTSQRAGAIIYLNGSNFMGTFLGGGNINSVNVQSIMTLAVNDYVELFGLQNTGGDAPIFGINAGIFARATAFGIQYLGA